MPLKAEPDKLEVRKQAEESAWDDTVGEEDLKEAEDGNCKLKMGRWKPTLAKDREASKPTGQTI